MAYRSPGSVSLMKFGNRLKIQDSSALSKSDFRGLFEIALDKIPLKKSKKLIHTA